MNPTTEFQQSRPISCTSKLQAGEHAECDAAFERMDGTLV